MPKRVYRLQLRLGRLVVREYRHAVRVSLLPYRQESTITTDILQIDAHTVVVLKPTSRR